MNKVKFIFLIVFLSVGLSLQSACSDSDTQTAGMATSAESAGGTTAGDPITSDPKNPEITNEAPQVVPAPSLKLSSETPSGPVVLIEEGAGVKINLEGFAHGNNIRLDISTGESITEFDTENGEFTYLYVYDDFASLESSEDIVLTFTLSDGEISTPDSEVEFVIHARVPAVEYVGSIYNHWLADELPDAAMYLSLDTGVRFTPAQISLDGSLKEQVHLIFYQSELEGGLLISPDVALELETPIWEEGYRNHILIKESNMSFEKWSAISGMTGLEKIESIFEAYEMSEGTPESFKKADPGIVYGIEYTNPNGLVQHGLFYLSEIVESKEGPLYYRITVNQ